METKEVVVARGSTRSGAFRSLVLSLILGGVPLMPYGASGDSPWIQPGPITLNPSTVGPVVLTLQGAVTDGATAGTYGLDLSYIDNPGQNLPPTAMFQLLRPTGQYQWQFTTVNSDNSLSDRLALQLGNDHSLTLYNLPSTLATSGAASIVLTPDPNNATITINSVRVATMADLAAGFAPLAGGGLSFNGTGNVGIGTTSPNYTLDVRGGISTILLYLPGSTDANTGIVYQGGERFLHSFGTDSTFLGRDAGNLRATPGNVADNVGVGTLALANIQTGSDNIAIGTYALTSLQTGYDNVAIGLNALPWAGNTSWNIAIGGGALQHVGTTSTQGSNIGIGPGAGYSANTSGNVYIGAIAGYAVPSGANNNTGLGAYSMNTNYFPPGSDSFVGGTENVAVGESSLGQIKTASMNTTIGAVAGGYIESGSSNTIVGWRAGMGIVTGQNNILIGVSADVDSTDPSNRLNIGNQIFGMNMNGNAQIGIGTTAPQTTLDVAGDATIRGVLRVPAAGDVGMGAFTNGTNPTPAQ